MKIFCKCGWDLQLIDLTKRDCPWWSNWNCFILVQLLNDGTAMKNTIKIPLKIKFGPLYDPASSLLGIYPKLLKTRSQKYIYAHLFIEVLFTVAKIWMQPWCLSTDERINKKWHIHLMEYYSLWKRKEIMSFPTVWMNVDDYAKGNNKSQKRQVLYDSIYMTYLK